MILKFFGHVSRAESKPVLSLGTPRCLSVIPALSVCLLIAAGTRPVNAQSAEPSTRTETIGAEQAAKSGDLHPYVMSRSERLFVAVDNYLTNGPDWHPFLENAYAGGGMPIGAGYRKHVSAYNTLDVRGSVSTRAYKRLEAEFLAPRLFARRASLTALVGWREATAASFWGVGNETSDSDRVQYGFRQTHGSVLMSVRPTRKVLLLQGGTGLSRYRFEPAADGLTSIETRLPQLPGVNVETTYLHSQATVGVDSRPAPGYARRGGYLGVTVHDYLDREDRFSFRRVDYEAVQHVPLLRETWALSLHGLVQTTDARHGQHVPFFFLPSLGGGSSLRAYSSQRYRDRHSLLMQAEWRIMVNRYMDTALFVDAGKVAAERSELNFHNLKTDYGFGMRFHSPFATPFRLDVAQGADGWRLVFATSASF